LSDRQELYFGLDPLSADSDNDGVADGERITCTGTPQCTTCFDVATGQEILRDTDRCPTEG
jgi:hypothetical protein